MCPLRFTLLPKTAGLYITTGMSTGKRNGEGTVGQGASFTHSRTHTNKYIVYPHRDRYVFAHTHKQFGSL